MSQLNINTIKNKRGDYGPNLVGHSTVTGDLTVTGNITGDGSGLTGLGNTANIKSDTISNSGIITATGFVGPLTGNVTGGVTGNVTGDVTGNLTGDVTGNLTGDVTGNLTGDVTGGVTGNVIGNVTGDVTGNLTGDVTGNITGTTGTFSGNVSIGGTLTYEDATNVDVVGMITARKGIQVLADGINAVGVVTATSFSGDGSDLTGVGGAGAITLLTSSTTLSSGNVYMINASNTITLTLPASPSTGDAVDILNNTQLIHDVSRNGSTIQGLSEDMTINITGVSFKIWYTGSTWRLF